MFMSSLRAPWQHGPYTNKHKEQHKNKYENEIFIQKKLLCVFFKRVLINSYNLWVYIHFG